MNQSISLNPTMRDCALKRLVNDMIGDVHKTSGPTEALIVMVVDDFTTKILSSVMSMSELLAKGIFSLEKLDLLRENYPKFHGLYFVSPTESAIKQIDKDFRDQDTPQYGKVHIFFSHSVSDSILGELGTNENLMKRLKTCKELNYSFLLKDLNLFDFGMSHALEIFTTRNNELNRNIILSHIAEKLFTVCTVLNDNPYIQFQKNSIFAQKLSEYVNSKLNSFYAKRTFNEKRGILLIVDRTLDIAGPLLHDYLYEPMIYDYIDIKNNFITFQKSKYKLDEKDKLWVKYKNKPIGEVFSGIQNDLNVFMQNDISKMQRGQEDDQNFEKMSKVLHGMKGYQQESKQFSVHLGLAEEINNKIKEIGIMDLIEVEQDIVTGQNEKGSSISTKDISNSLALVGGKLRDKEKIRLLLTLQSSFDIEERNFLKIAENFGYNENQLTSIKKLKWLGIDFGSTKSKRDAKAKTKGKVSNYKMCRSTPKIENIALSCSQYQLSKSDYPFIDEPAEIPKAVNKGYAIKQNYGNEVQEKKPYMIVFMIGGIAHNEISSLERIHEEKLLNHNLIVGSTCVMNGDEYVAQLNELPGLDDDLTALKLNSIEIKID